MATWTVTSATSWASGNLSANQFPFDTKEASPDPGEASFVFIRTFRQPRLTAICYLFQKCSFYGAISAAFGSRRRKVRKPPARQEKVRVYFGQNMPHFPLKFMIQNDTLSKLSVLLDKCIFYTHSRPNSQQNKHNKQYFSRFCCNIIHSNIIYNQIIIKIQKIILTQLCTCGIIQPCVRDGVNLIDRWK